MSREDYFKSLRIAIHNGPYDAVGVMRALRACPTEEARRYAQENGYGGAVVLVDCGLTVRDFNLVMRGLAHVAARLADGFRVLGKASEQSVRLRNEGGDE